VGGGLEPLHQEFVFPLARIAADLRALIRRMSVDNRCSSRPPTYRSNRAHAIKRSVQTASRPITILGSRNIPRATCEPAQQKFKEISSLGKQILHKHGRNDGSGLALSLLRPIGGRSLFANTHTDCRPCHWPRCVIRAVNPGDAFSHGIISNHLRADAARPYAFAASQGDLEAIKTIVQVER
jgi:hypothetical protein